MTRKERQTVNDLVCNAMIMVALNEKLIAEAKVLTVELAVAKNQRNNAVVLARSWNPYRIWTS